jgi:hypothetical protein
MTSNAGSKRPRRARRWAGAILAAVLLPVGAGLLLYPYLLGDDHESNASPPTTVVSSVLTMPADNPTPSPGGTTSGPAPEPSVTTIYHTIAIAPTDPGSEGPDILALVTTISGLLASAAGIVSAFVSARAPKRQ